MIKKLSNIQEAKILPTLNPKNFSKFLGKLEYQAPQCQYFTSWGGSIWNKGGGAWSFEERERGILFNSVLSNMGSVNFVRSIRRYIFFTT